MGGEHNMGLNLTVSSGSGCPWASGLSLGMRGREDGGERTDSPVQASENHGVAER